MKNKGFTLIELLAVIVILAIIALIATPIILGIINDSKKQSEDRSAELYLDAAKKAIARYQANNPDVDFSTISSCAIESNEIVCTDAEDNDHHIPVEMSGQSPTSGTIKLSNGNVTNGTSIVYGEDKTYNYINGKLVLDGSNNTDEEENSCYVYKTEEITYTGINESKCVEPTKKFFETMGEDISEVPDSYFESICDGTGDMEAEELAGEYEAYLYLLYANDGLEGVNVTQELENATILRYTCDETDVEIPSTLGGKNVTEIGEGAFASTGLTSVVIPNSVTAIDHTAFIENQLESIIIPSSVTSIGDSAFEGNQLTSVTIPNSVTTIGVDAFKLNLLASVTIGSGIEEIGESAFGCGDSDKNGGYGPNVINLVSIDKLENDSNLSIGFAAFCWINNKTDANISWKTNQM